MAIAGSTFIDFFGGKVFATGSRDQKDKYIKSGSSVGLGDSNVTIEANYVGSAAITMLLANASVAVLMSGWTFSDYERFIYNEAFRVF